MDPKIKVGSRIKFIRTDGSTKIATVKIINDDSYEVAWTMERTVYSNEVKEVLPPVEEPEEDEKKENFSHSWKFYLLVFLIISLIISLVFHFMFRQVLI